MSTFDHELDLTEHPEVQECGPFMTWSMRNYEHCIELNPRSLRVTMKSRRGRSSSVS